MAHPYIFAAILVVLSGACASIGGVARSTRILTMFLVSLAVFAALAGIGAVFGKVLGDFLRNVNG